MFIVDTKAHAAAAYMYQCSWVVTVLESQATVCQLRGNRRRALMTYVTSSHRLLHEARP